MLKRSLPVCQIIYSKFYSPNLPFSYFFSFAICQVTTSWVNQWHPIMLKFRFIYSEIKELNKIKNKQTQTDKKHPQTSVNNKGELKVTDDNLFFSHWYGIEVSILRITTFQLKVYFSVKMLLLAFLYRKSFFAISFTFSDQCGVFSYA